MTHLPSWPILLGLSGLVGCSSLKTVSTFSTAATTTVQQATTVPVTFADVYQQRVVTDSLDRHPFNRIPLVGINFANRVRRDSVRLYKRADSLSLTMNTLLTEYFGALTALSSTGKTAPVVQLTKSPSFDSFLLSSAVKLTTEQAVSVNQLTNLLGSVATGAYRRRQVVRLLDNSHHAVGQVLDALTFTYGRLAEVVALSRDQQYNAYKNVLIRDPKLPYLQKRDLAKQWLQTAGAIEKNQQAILAHVNRLKTLRTDYDNLYRQYNGSVNKFGSSNRLTYTTRPKPF